MTGDVAIMAAIGGYQAGFDAVRELLTEASKAQQFDSWRAENVAMVLEGQWRVIHRHGDILTPIEAR